MNETLPQLDELFDMAQSDPEKLESLRRRCVESIINSAPASIQRRLRGLQFQIDCHRQKHKNPIGACIEISRMMHESLHQLHDALNQTHSEQEDNEAQTNATILPFRVCAQ